MNKILTLISTHKKTFMILLVSLVIAGFLHGFNMFHYPYFENDEGTYFSQAYAVAYQGKLTDYTYWYDHIPIGWMQVAIWMLVSGGPFSFGYSLFSARVLMLIFYVVSCALIFFIVRKLTKKDWAAFISVILISVTPLGVYFQRRLLLDNIMILWVLLVIFLLLYAKSRLHYVIFAGLSFAVAVLSKETALITIPAFWFLTYLSLHRKQKILGVIVFTLPVILGVGYFFLYAIFKNEFFPGANHVSLVGTWTYQLMRGTHLAFWKSGSDFMQSFADWWGRDKFYLLLMVVSTVWAAFGLRKSLVIRGVAFVGVIFWLFTMRGGLTINYYVIPSIALGAITTGILISDLIDIKYLGGITIFVLMVLWIINLNYTPWMVDESSPQIASVNWVKKNIPSNATIAVDDSQLLDLRISRFPGDPSFNQANWFWKLQDDPAIKEHVILNDWQNINYLLLSHEFIHQIQSNSLPFLVPVISHSQELASWGPNSSGTYVNVDQLISTNGDWSKVYKVLDRYDIVLVDSWRIYLKNFVSSDGQVTDPATGFTTSEGQSYAMLRSVIEGDKASFDNVWNWTRWHLQFRNEDKLLSWKWSGSGANSKELDSASATDADIDTATALVLASKKWNNQTYLDEAKLMINDIWRQQVVKLDDGYYYLLAGSWAGYGDTITINPSYISPASFRIFAGVDSTHDWPLLISNSYHFLNRLSQYNSDGLPSDWISVDKKTGDLVSPQDINLSTNFSYDAMRVYYRVSEDAIWFNSKEAISYLKNNNFLVDYWKMNGKIPTGFDTSGKPTTNQESNAFYGAFLPYFKIVDSSIYTSVKNKLQSDYVSGAWKFNDNYYTQNWVWLGLALTEGKYTHGN